MMGESLNQSYAHLFGDTKTYFGLEDGFWCSGPLTNSETYTKDMNEGKTEEDEDYY
jgi:hypothetical protein